MLNKVECILRIGQNSIGSYWRHRKNLSKVELPKVQEFHPKKAAKVPSQLLESLDFLMIIICIFFLVVCIVESTFIPVTTLPNDVQYHISDLVWKAKYQDIVLLLDAQRDDPKAFQSACQLLYQLIEHSKQLTLQMLDDMKDKRIRSEVLLIIITNAARKNNGNLGLFQFILEYKDLVDWNYTWEKGKITTHVSLPISQEIDKKAYAMITTLFLRQYEHVRGEFKQRRYYEALQYALPSDNIFLVHSVLEKSQWEFEFLDAIAIMNGFQVGALNALLHVFDYHKEKFWIPIVFEGKKMRHWLRSTLGRKVDDLLLKTKNPHLKLGSWIRLSNFSTLR
jgi:hypothetical protein